MSDAVPSRFNMAAFCLADQPAARQGLLLAAGADGGIERWSYGALRDGVLRIGAGLLGAGLGPGDVVMLRLGHHPLAPQAFFGCIAVGLVALPVSPQLTPAEIGFLLRDSGARALLAAERVDLPAGIAMIDAAALASWLDHGPLADFADLEADAPAFLVYTSGTSGRPKAVRHAQRSAWGRRPMHQGWQGLGPDDTLLHTGALNWTYTLGVGLTDPWAQGATAAIVTGEVAAAAWPQLIRRLDASILASVPGIYRRLLREAMPGPGRLGWLRHGLSAGEALPAATLEAWRDRTGLEIYEAFGMSEISTWISQAPPGPAIAGTPGRAQPGRRVAVLPVDGPAKPLPAGETGLIAIHRSDPGLMLGYLDRPEEEALAFRGDWFVSGDLVRVDGDGLVWYQGRSDDQMNAGGHRVSPLEVEAVLTRHPAIAEVAVAERQVATGTAVVAAWVVLRDGAVLDEAALLAWLDGRLAFYKRPRLVSFVAGLPRSANGKLLRRLLPGRRAC